MCSISVALKPLSTCTPSRCSKRRCRLADRASPAETHRRSDTSLACGHSASASSAENAAGTPNSTVGRAPTTLAGATPVR